MKRSALVGAALAAVAAMFAVGVAGASASHSPKIHFSPVYVSIADGQAVEGQTGALKLSVVKPFAPQSGLPDTHIVWKTISGGTAILGTDYAAQSNTATLAPGQTAKDIMVNSMDDNIYQSDHTFKVQISSPDPWVIITRDKATFTIHDNDPMPAVTIHDQSAPAVYEGGSLTWTVGLSNPSAFQITVPLDYNYPVDTTVIPADYTGTLPSSVMFAPGETVKTITITSIDDGLAEPTEAVWIHLMPPIGSATLPAVDYVYALDQTDRWGVGWISDLPAQP